MKLLFQQIRRGELVDPSELLQALSEVFPLIGSLEKTPQDAEWHAEGNVHIHTKMVIREAISLVRGKEGEGLSEEDRLILVLGAALHDIGKALTTKECEIDGKTRIVSPRHPERGRSYTAPRIPQLNLSWATCDAILALIGYHHDPGKWIARGYPQRRFVALRRQVDFQLVYLLELADLRGRIMKNGTADRDGFGMIELFREAAIDYGLWERDVDFYSDWKEKIRSELSSAKEVRYVICNAIRDFESGKIFTPEEAISRTWEHRSAYPEVLILCGPSGSGKSRWIERNGSGSTIISLDKIRFELTGKADDQSKNGAVLQAAKEKLRQGLRQKKSVIWDATCLRSDGRAMVLDLARDYHALTRIMCFACPPNVAMKQNRSRKRVVADSVIERQYDRLQWPELLEADLIDVIAVV